MSSSPRQPQAHGGALRLGGPNRGGGRHKEPHLVETALRLPPREAVRRLGAIVQGAPMLFIDSHKRRRIAFRSPPIRERIRALEALARIACITEAAAGAANQKMTEGTNAPGGLS